jgi:2-oxo-4-hydroxy-4-carboxy-5-ureidoimidazoline decarboxylase
MSISKTNTTKIDRALLEQICSSQRWQTLVLRRLASTNDETSLSLVLEHANHAFCELNESDWLEAFSGHPMIGDIDSLRSKYAQGKALSENEQSQVSQASESTLQTLLEMNLAYLDKFGFIFIVCATNKSAQQMLSLLQSRITNTRPEELLNASIEQRKISQIRMENLL